MKLIKLLLSCLGLSAFYLSLAMEPEPKKIRIEEAPTQQPLSLWCSALKAVAQKIIDAPEIQEKEIAQVLPFDLQGPAVTLALVRNDMLQAYLLTKFEPEKYPYSSIFKSCIQSKDFIKIVDAIRNNDMNAALLLAKLEPQLTFDPTIFINNGAEEVVVNYIKDYIDENNGSLNDALIALVNEEEPDDDDEYDLHLVAVKTLLNAGADINVKNKQNLERTVLMSAVRKQDYGLIELLLQFSPIIDEKDNNGETAYYDALEVANNILDDVASDLQENNYSPTIYEQKYPEIRNSFDIIALIQAHNPLDIINNYGQTTHELLTDLFNTKKILEQNLEHPYSSESE